MIRETKAYNNMVAKVKWKFDCASFEVLKLFGFWQKIQCLSHNNKALSLSYEIFLIKEKRS